MSMSNEMQKNIEQFAREQAQFYLDDAELTYIEKLRKKGSATKGKIVKKLAKFGGSTDKSREAQGDMILYMNDYMNDLMSQGLTELEAFEKAKAKLAFESKSSQVEDIKEQYMKNYFNNPNAYEAIGMYYASFSIIGIVVGLLAGIILGVYLFTAPIWIPIVISTAAGMFLGVAIAMLFHASVVRDISR